MMWSLEYYWQTAMVFQFHYSRRFTKSWRPRLVRKPLVLMHLVMSLRHSTKVVLNSEYRFIKYSDFSSQMIIIVTNSANCTYSSVIVSRLQKTFYGVTVFKNIHNLENIWNDQWIVLYYLVIWNFPIRDHTNTYCTNFLYIHVFWLSQFQTFHIWEWKKIRF